MTAALVAAGGSDFVDLTVEPWHWAVLLGVVVILLLVDLLVLHREAHEIKPREAAIESAVWVSIGLAFSLLVWRWFGAAATTEYLYGNPGDAFQVTAVRAPSGELSQYRYDEDGLLFAMDRGGARYAIATDQAGTPRVVVLTDHVARDGSPKLVKECDLPLTGAKVVKRIITDLAVLDVTTDGLRLVELAHDVTEEQVRAATEPPLLPYRG